MLMFQCNLNIFFPLHNSFLFIFVSFSMFFSDLAHFAFFSTAFLTMLFYGISAPISVHRDMRKSPGPLLLQCAALWGLPENFLHKVTFWGSEWLKTLLKQCASTRNLDSSKISSGAPGTFHSTFLLFRQGIPVSRWDPVLSWNNHMCTYWPLFAVSFMRFYFRVTALCTFW